MSPSTPRRALLAAGLVAAAVTAGVLASPAGTAAFVADLAADPVAFGAVVAALYLVRPLLAWPTTPLAAVVGYGYGVFPGVPIALAGVLVTVTPVYVATRRFAGGASLEDLAALPFGGVLAGTGRGVRRYYETAGPLRGVTASRLAPIPSDVATCAAAASAVPYREFALGTAIGELPWTVAAVVVGSSAATVATDGLGALGAWLAVGCAVAAAALLARPVYGLVRGGRERAADPS